MNRPPKPHLEAYTDKRHQQTCRYRALSVSRSSKPSRRRREPASAPLGARGDQVERTGKGDFCRDYCIT